MKILRSVFFLMLLVLAPSVVIAQSLGGGATAPDPYAYTVIQGTIPDYKNTIGLPRVAGVVPAFPSAAVIVTLGQSLWANNATGTYTTINAGSQQFNIRDGGVYPCTGQTLGSSDSSAGIGQSSPNCPTADGLITNSVFPRVIMVTIAVDGTSAGQWNGPELSSKIKATWNRLVTLGHTPDYIMWHQGQADVQLATPTATYTANIQAVAQQWRTLGYTGPFFVDQDTMVTNVTSSTYRAAQAAAVSAPLHIVLGSDVDSLTGGTNRQADGVHLTQTGAVNAANLDVTVITNCKNTSC
jgi:hypothetical protein